MGPRVGDVMLRHPKVTSHRDGVGELRALLAKAKVHAGLVVDDAGRLVSVVEPTDLDEVPDDELAGAVGTLVGRTVTDSDEVDAAWTDLRQQGRRRLAVVDDDGLLVGLLCLKRHGAGFCSDTDVRARESERAASP